MTDDAGSLRLQRRVQGNDRQAIAEKGLFTLEEVRAHTKGLVVLRLVHGAGRADPLRDRQSRLFGDAEGKADVRLYRSSARCGAQAPIVAGVEDDAGGHGLLHDWKTPNGCHPAGRAELLSVCAGPANTRTITSRASSTSAPTPTSRSDGPIRSCPAWGGLTSTAELRAIADVADRHQIPTVR